MDNVNSISTDKYGSVYITGSTQLHGYTPTTTLPGITFGNGPTKGFITKYDQKGTKQWTRILWTTEHMPHDPRFTADVADDGSIYIAGTTKEFSDYDLELDKKLESRESNAVIAKYNPDGSIAWVKTLDGLEWANSISISQDHSLYVAGFDRKNWDGQTYDRRISDAFLAKYNADGSKEWVHTFGGSEDDYANSVDTANDGSVYVVGSTDIYGRGLEAFIEKYDALGSQVWTRLIGGGAVYDYKNRRAFSVSTANDGSVYIAGRTASGFNEQNYNGGVSDAFLVKYSANGDLEWTRILGGSGDDEAKSVCVTDDGSILIAGSTGFEGFVAKYGSDGSLKWTQLIDGLRRNIPGAIHSPENGLIFVGGQTLDNTNTGSMDAFIATINEVQDTYTTSKSISSSGLAYTYRNVILTGFDPINAVGNIYDNTLTGNNAPNILDGRAGADIMIGMGGNDHYIVENVGDQITELVSAGTDTVQSSIAYALAENLENLTLLGSVVINGTGNSANNVLTGNTGANVLNGNGGTDTLIGGRGNDTYIVDSADDIINESGSSKDIDSVQASVSWSLGANLENLTLTGTSAIDGTGNTLNNTISGTTTNNLLDGGNGGTDRLTGLTGADTFRFSARPSSFINATTDRITDFSSAQGDKIQIAKSAFGITASTATLSVVSNAAALNTALSGSAQFIYNTANGELHWNQNGITRGAGSGGVLAILDNKATLSSGDLVLV